MIIKNLIIFSLVCGSVFASYAYVALILEPLEYQKKVHNLPEVINCDPSNYDEKIKYKSIGNYTHRFDLQSCQWIINEKYPNE